MDFSDNKFETKTVDTKDFVSNVRDLIYGGYVIHHSHVTGEVIGYAHDFCNKKMRENHNLIPVFAHNLFSFYFFFVLKGIKLCVWRTKQLNIGGTNLTNVQYAYIGNQVKFIDTVKYYQHSLSSRELEKKMLEACAWNLFKITELIQNFLADNEKNWVLDYLCGGKGVIPYE